jgi:hypothetical protein
LVRGSSNEGLGSASFVEVGEAGGGEYAVFSRETNGASAVYFLGQGMGDSGTTKRRSGHGFNLAGQDYGYVSITWGRAEHIRAKAGSGSGIIFSIQR